LHKLAIVTLTTTHPGNEFSFYMLFSSNFILNRVSAPEEFSIYPFIHSFSNIRDTEQQLGPIKIPDVLPSSLPPTADFSMVAGDFIEVYGENDTSEGECSAVHGIHVGGSDHGVAALFSYPVVCYRAMGCGCDLFLHRHCQEHHSVPGSHTQDLEARRHVD
jgi:hypothetical protein